MSLGETSSSVEPGVCLWARVPIFEAYGALFKMGRAYHRVISFSGLLVLK